MVSSVVGASALGGTVQSALDLHLHQLNLQSSLAYVANPYQAVLGRHCIIV
jgi:hypothetical protein